ncbi:MAG TPA: TetR/AcrR family transcriptional regulator [Agromyces sp.]|nr:TetR/AcrR family transcriptional regulator [Agromyces sp.]
MSTEERAEPELPRAVALAWGVAANPQRGPKREMSIERIVEVAVEIADAEGLAAVSMSRVAAALGYTTMSLYRYVTAKDDLIALMQEYGTGLPPEPDPEPEPGDWRDRMRFLARAQHATYRAHPWLLDIPIEGTPVTPNNIAWMDAMLETLSQLPLTEYQRTAVMLLFTGQMRWQGTIERSYEVAANAAGVDPQSIDDARDAILDALVTAEEFPFVRRAIDAGVFREGDDPLAFGFERIIDGVERFIAGQNGGEVASARRRIQDGAASGSKGAADLEDDAEVLADRRVREAQKAKREAEKRLRDARKAERVAIKDARARVANRAAKDAAKL